MANHVKGSPPPKASSRIAKHGVPLTVTLAAALGLAGLTGACGTSNGGDSFPFSQRGGGSGNSSGDDGGPSAESTGSTSSGGSPTGGGLGFHPTFTFESGPVRPLAMSPDGTTLFVANTSNASLDYFHVTEAGLVPGGSVYVGVDPVAVAARTNTEVWVVNQVSDSVSIVDMSTAPPHVERTLVVGDEPSDIVFAGPGVAGTGAVRAFITTAHRGQQRTDPSIANVPGAGDPQLTTPGVGRADVWVFDPTNLGTNAGGMPLGIVKLFGDTPRALAVTPDGNTVYVAIFKSGNQTTTISSMLACPGYSETDAGDPCYVNGLIVPGSPPGPATNYKGVPAPQVAMILKTDAKGVWRDLLGRDWSSATVFSLPDQDVFAIDAATLATKAAYAHVGTTLFGMAVNPTSGNVYVTNTESRNDLRFEGPGKFAHQTLQGHLAESRLTVLTASSVTPRYLNKHIDYSQLPAPTGIAEASLATPLDVVVSKDGQTMYISAFGSSKIGVLPTADVENDSFNPLTASKNYLTVTGGGPGGMVLDEAHKRLYVTTRFDDGLSVVNLADGTETSHLLLSNPEPAAITSGRPFFYDATKTSSNGEASCSSCHPFGDDDHLAWDIGNPDADPVLNPVNIKLALAQLFPEFSTSCNLSLDLVTCLAEVSVNLNGTKVPQLLHPMKGPMATQTLRGTVNHGPMHWRGDLANGYFGVDTSLGPPYNSRLSFLNTLPEFNTLLGLGPEFSSTDMQTYTDFVLSIAMPPNAVRALDNSLTAAQAYGKSFYFGCEGPDSVTGLPSNLECIDGQPPLGIGGHFSDGFAAVPIETIFGFTCNGCHTLDPAQGFYGTDGESSFEGFPQTNKVPQLRNLYEKIGMFGNIPDLGTSAAGTGPVGPQVRGTGFLNDGSVDTIFRFFQGNVFQPEIDIIGTPLALGNAVGFRDEALGDVVPGYTERRAMEQYMLAFEGDLAPIVGQQVTLRSDNATAAGPRVDLLIARAAAPFVSKLLGGRVTECDLVAHAAIKGQAVTFVYDVKGKAFVGTPGNVTLTDAQVRAYATTPGQEVTYTCLPPGWQN